MPNLRKLIRKLLIEQANNRYSQHDIDEVMPIVIRAVNHLINDREDEEYKEFYNIFHIDRYIDLIQKQNGNYDNRFSAALDYLEDKNIIVTDSSGYYTIQLPEFFQTPKIEN
jgi:hypothetical protein